MSPARAGALEARTGGISGSSSKGGQAVMAREQHSIGRIETTSINRHPRVNYPGKEYPQWMS